jgi:site-specific recombinase XerD
MPRKIEKKERGVFEKEPGSDIWWIRYHIDGRERREKVGRRGDAIKLYKVRKTDALRGVKLPATKNRYKNVFGRTFKNALADGKVTSNPARLVEQRPESNGRIRFLSDEEETILREAINRRCPDHMEEFDIALNTGMRKSEQYTTEWPQISFKRKRIKLEGTKNGSDREIPMNKTCISAFEALYKRRPHNGRVHQSKFKHDLNDSRAWFERCVEDAGIVKFTWHCLRHTFISRLVMKGVDLRTVQELVGHKTISMTVRYAHLAPEHNQAAVEKLDSAAA